MPGGKENTLRRIGEDSLESPMSSAYRPPLSPSNSRLSIERPPSPKLSRWDSDKVRSAMKTQQEAAARW